MSEIEKYRPRPLTKEEFQKLEILSERFMTVREKMTSKSLPKVDNAGEVYGWERHLVPVGVEVIFKADPDERVMESLVRIASDIAIAKALTDLEAHRTYGRGDSGWAAVLRDLVKDLAGCSEWALLKTCETFRQERGGRFFPQTGDLVHAVRNLDEQTRWAYAARPSSKKPQNVEPVQEIVKTDEGRERVAKTLHDANLAHDKTFCVQCREASGKHEAEMMG